MKDEFAFMEEYIIDEKERNCVHVLIKNIYGEYDFEPLDIKIPQIDISLNYGESFSPIYDKIVHKLKNNNKGLYMFHGDPGTGKSSFIKYLSKQIDKDFIFIPSNFIDKFISDPDIFSILLKKKKSVIILEDAEKILISREREDNQHISTILNISDGILSDILEISVIITYNCDDTKIDKALKRKGRTMIDYMFKKLNVNDSKKLAEYLSFKKEQIDNIKEPMSLSEIYNMNDENKFYDENDLEDKKRIIGFGGK
jgi:broad-specificity NMP kinase